MSDLEFVDTIRREALRRFGRPMPDNLVAIALQARDYGVGAHAFIDWVARNFTVDDAANAVRAERA